MKTKVKLISNESGEVEFVATKKEKVEGTSKLVLKTAKYGSWSDEYKNKKLVEIEDDGNIISIKSEGGVSISLEYDAFESLYLAMREFVMTESNFMPEYKRLVKLKESV
jgi:hypothetical protein